MTIVKDDLGCLDVSTTGSQLLRINLSISFSAQPGDIELQQLNNTSYSKLCSLYFNMKWAYVSNYFCYSLWKAFQVCHARSAI